MKSDIKKGFFAELKEKRVSTVAAAWVFYFLTALLPTVFLLITAFAVFGVDLKEKVIGYLPEEFRTAGETIFSVAKNASDGATVFFVATVLFSGSALLNQMSKDGEFLYGSTGGIRAKNGIVRRIWAVFALCVLFAVFMVSAFAVAFKDMILPQVSGSGNIWILALAFSFVVATGYFIIILLNKFIAPIKIPFSALAAGSFVALLAIVAGTIGFTVYLRFFKNYNAFYGSLAAIIVFLLWVYIAMTGLSFGAFVCKRASEKVLTGAEKTVKTFSSARGKNKNAKKENAATAEKRGNAATAERKEIAERAENSVNTRAERKTLAAAK